MQQINLSNSHTNKYSFKQKEIQANQRKENIKNIIIPPLLSLGFGLSNEFFINVLSQFYNESILKKMGKINNSLTNFQIQKFEKDFNDVFTKLKLKDYGVSIFRFNNLESDAKRLKEYIAKNINSKNQSIINRCYYTIMYQMTKGNSCYAFFDKTIYTSKNSRLSLFHEMGHALNDNKSYIPKFLQKYRNLYNYIASPCAIFAIALSSPQNVKNNKQNNHNNENNNSNILTKLKNSFVKFSPLILFLSFMPEVLEEGIASLKGQKFAKNVLDKDIFKKVKRSNLLGFSTYLLRAIIFSLSLWITLKLKNMLQDKLLNKT